MAKGTNYVELFVSSNHSENTTFQCNFNVIERTKLFSENS